MKSFQICVKDQNQKIRLDRFLCDNIEGISRSYVQKLIEDKLIKVNEEHVTKNHKLNLGEIITVNIPEPQAPAIQAETIPLNVVYEDDDVIVINKPKDMVVHPAPGNYSGTLVNALLAYCKDTLSGINGITRPGIVHRIDKDTSGLLVIAKNDESHRSLALQIKEHSFTREYEAIIKGNLKEKQGSIKTFIGRHKIDRKKMSVLKNEGRIAITHYQTIKSYDKYSHIKLKLETGRTHQIRVHMSYLGNPLLGDEVYGKNQNNPFDFLKGQCLHARTLGFVHPTLKKYMEFTSDLPPYFQEVLRNLEDN